MKFLLYLVLIFVVPNIALADPCIDRVPAKLQYLLHQRFINERLPIAIDSAEDNRLQAKKVGKCLLETRIDLDGDGRKDFVLLMPSVKQPMKYRLVAALLGTHGWSLTTIEEDTGEFAVLALNPASAGLYVHTEAFPFVAEPGAVERFHAKHNGFYIGVVEGAADAYFLDDGRWIHVHSID